MKRVSLFFLLIAMLSAMLAALPVAADNTVDGCEALNDPARDGTYHTSTIGGSPKQFFAGDRITISSTANDSIYLKFSNVTVASGSNPLVYIVPADTIINPITYGTQNLTVGTMNVTCERGYSSGESVALPCGAVLDGRLNNRPDLDCGAPVAAYSADLLDVFAVNPLTGDGTLLFRVAPDSLTASPTNQTLWQGTNPYNGTPVIVSLLSTGELQINAFYADWKPYTIAWPVDAPQDFYHIAW